MRKYSLLMLLLIMVGFFLAEGSVGVSAVIVALIASTLCILTIRFIGFENRFLTDVFLLALVTRLAFGLFIHIAELREFFGGDALTFDIYGYQIIEVWAGRSPADDPLSARAMSTGTPGWGIHYLTALVYLVFGRNILAAQTLIGVIGAATAPLVYYCAYQMFRNHRVGKVSSVLVAVFPAFVVWSSQLLKDGVIIFLLVLAMTMVLSLQTRLDYRAVVVLVFALFGIISFRFYIFYMVAVAAAGSLVIGREGSVKSLLRGGIALVGLGLALTYVGVLQTASDNFGKFGNLEAVQRSRADLAKSAESGFGEDTDVSTAEGALTMIPTGLTYLMFAPFPWAATSLRQSITIPETLMWWAMLPLLISGLIYTVKYKLRPALPVLVFSLMLTFGYSIFQGNVGTAYRQRTQIQVFFFIFIGVGYTVLKEKRENLLAVRRARIEKLEAHLRRARV